MCSFNEKLVLSKGLRSDAARRMVELTSKLDELKHKKRVTEDVVAEAERRNDEIKDQLRNNENYRQISHLEEKLTDLTDESKTLQDSYEQMKHVRISLNFLENILNSIFSFAGSLFRGHAHGY